MESLELELTQKQRAILAESMGIVCDKLILSSLEPDEKEMKVQDLGEDLILAMSQTFTQS